MKKVFCVVVSLVLAVGILTSCGTPAPQGSGITAEEILSSFEAKLSPLVDQFQSTRLPSVDLEEGETYQPLVITDPLLNHNYHLSVRFTSDGDAKRATLTADKGTGPEIDFALLSYYLYKSMGLPEMDAQEFYDHFSLLTEEPSGRMTIEGWELWAFSVADTLTFSATYGAE